MSDQMVLMERRIRQGEDDRVGDVLDMPMDFRVYTPVPSVPEAPVISERVLDLERAFEEELVLIEDQTVNGVPLETWARSEPVVKVQDWTRADLVELEEWDRVHTLPIVSYVHDDSPGEVEIGMAIQRGVDMDEGFEEYFEPWARNQGGFSIIPIMSQSPVFEEEEEEEDGEGEMVEADWSVTLAVWDRETV